MTLSLDCVTLVVRDYDEAIDFFTRVMGFTLVEDSVVSPGKRWVVVAPGANGTRLLLARAVTPAQEQAIGHQTGGRVAFFLRTDDLQQAYTALRERGVEFVETPRAEPYGTVAVFVDLYGNRWDLIAPLATPRSSLLTR